MWRTAIACAVFSVGVRAEDCSEQYAKDNPDWIFLPTTGKCYGIFEAGTQYHCELAVCSQRNASLACVDSEETDFALAEMIADHDDHRDRDEQVWTGCR